MLPWTLRTVKPGTSELSSALIASDAVHTPGVKFLSGVHVSRRCHAEFHFFGIPFGGIISVPYHVISVCVDVIIIGVDLLISTFNGV